MRPETSVRRNVAATAGLILSLLLPLGTAQAFSVDQYLKIDGIDGESTDSSHEDWTEIESFSWGVSNLAGTSGTSGGRPVFTDFRWTQFLDSTIPPLMVATANGQHFERATLELVRADLAGSGRGTVFFTMTLDNVVMRSLNLNAQAGPTRPGAALSLAYDRITMEYRQILGDGTIGAISEGSWDLQANKTTGSFELAMAGLVAAGGVTTVEPGAMSFAVGAPVPEPGTYVLMAVGALVVGTAVRRRRDRRSRAG